MKNIVKSDHKEFIGRAAEIHQMESIGRGKRAAIVAVYGRRRVGKTTLVEYVYRQRSLLKIEGVEGGNKARQIETALIMLAHYAKDPSISRLKFDRWLEFFEYLVRFVAEGEHTLYLEELQWLASYDDELISDLKIIWDLHFCKNPRLVLVLCGSSPSFMINKVLRSKALYGRSQHELHIEPFKLSEVLSYFGKDYALGAVMDSYLSVGGIPEYLAYLKQGKSSYLDLCREAFTKNGYFFNECERVFISSLGNNQNYRKIIELLAKERFLSRPDLAKKLGIESGGTLSTLLHDLESSGFIHSYNPFDKEPGSKLTRYEVADHYLQFYYRFIAPKNKQIINDTFLENPTKALNLVSYQQWLGYSFERWCRHQQASLAKILGFSAVEYTAGPYFSQSTPQGFQIDLVFSRADRVLTVCEIKYTRMPIAKSVIKEFERKMEHFPIPRRFSIQRVLISAAGVEQGVVDAAYFDEIIDLERLAEF